MPVRTRLTYRHSPGLAWPPLRPTFGSFRRELAWAARSPSGPVSQAEVPIYATEAIRGYIDHLNDVAYVRAVFAIADVPAIGAVLEHMIRHGDRSDVRDALLFTEDVIRFGMHFDFASWFGHSPLL